ARGCHELLRQGTSVIFVSHNLYLVQAVCKNAIYLDRGQAVAFGPTPEIINQYERTLHKQRAAKLAQNDNLTGPRGLSAIEIVKVEMVGADDHYHNEGELLSSAPAQLQIHYQAYDDVGPVSVAAHIVRSDGLTCCQMRTKLDGVTMDIGRGTGVVTIKLDPLQLVGGAYYAEGHFLNADDYMGIATGRSDWFQVKGTGLSYEERSGVFEPRARWEHHELGTQTVPAGEMEPSTISRRDGRSNA
ncbi:MAG: hypothetical protein H3C34_21850, partial [Caldilineaceae bacterium]|nr:hypothetical protein [Caldilineaceae bacterium]